jgi:hypothetical protein
MPRALAAIPGYRSMRPTPSQGSLGLWPSPRLNALIPPRPRGFGTVLGRTSLPRTQLAVGDRSRQHVTAFQLRGSRSKRHSRRLKPESPLAESRSSDRLKMALSSLRCCSTPASGQSNARICASAFRSESRAGRTLEIAMLSIVRLTQPNAPAVELCDLNPLSFLRRLRHAGSPK